MGDVLRLKLNRNGGVYLPAAVREQAGFKAEDVLELRINDQGIELTKATPEYHYAEWRSISHELILERQQKSA